MQSCWTISRIRNESVFVFTYCLVITALLFYLGVQELFRSVGGLFLIIPGIFVFSFGFYYHAVSRRKYIVDESGITIQYFNCFKVTHSWAEISSIYVCEAYFAAKPSCGFALVIRLVIGPELHGPVSEVQPRVGLYNLENWKLRSTELEDPSCIIMIEYSENRLKQIQECSKREIPFFLNREGREQLSMTKKDLS